MEFYIEWAMAFLKVIGVMLLIFLAIAIIAIFWSLIHPLAGIAIFLIGYAALLSWLMIR